MNVLNNLQRCWKKLLAADFIFKAIAFIVLTPLVSLTFRATLAISGREVIADTDIASFLLHPFGILSAILLAAILLSIFAIEIAILMTLAIAAETGHKIRIRDAIQFVLFEHSLLVLRLAFRIVAEALLIAVPFIAAAGLVFWMMLTEHDINFYLTQKPPQFWIASSCIGLLLAIGAAIIFRRAMAYLFAPQILIFEETSPRSALQMSSQRSVDSRKKLALTLGIWIAFNFALGMLINTTVGFVGQQIIMSASGSMWALVLAVGAAVGLVGIGNLLGSAAGNITLASLLAMAYMKLGKPSNGALDLPNTQTDRGFSGLKVTPLRVIAGLSLAVAAAGLFGRMVVNSFNLNDDVVITAHRGGATAAPENTIAAIQQAIEDQADWIEIDVQESRDGVVLVVHDSDLKKVGGPATKIWEATADELMKIDIGSYHGPQFNDQRIPTLDDVLKICNRRVKVNIELKYYGHPQALESKVVDIVEANEMEDQIVIMSLKQAGLDKIKSMRPDWTCGLLTAVSVGDLTKVNADFLAVSAGLATPKLINRAHAIDKEVAAWTLNDAYSLSLMISRGVDNLITDDPALARRVLAQRAELSAVDRMSLELAFYFGIKPKSFAQ